MVTTKMACALCGERAPLHTIGLVLYEEGSGGTPSVVLESNPERDFYCCKHATVVAECAVRFVENWAKKDVDEDKCCAYCHIVGSLMHEFSFKLHDKSCMWTPDDQVETSLKVRLCCVHTTFFIKELANAFCEIDVLLKNNWSCNGK